MRTRGTTLGSIRGLIATGLLSGAALAGATIALRTLWPWIKPDGIPGEPVLTGAPTDSPELAARQLEFPVRGLSAEVLTDSFGDPRGGGRRRHEAVDIPAPRGTAVLAVEGGRVLRLHRSGAGGLTVYHLDPTGRYTYYYAHLDGYAPGLADGQTLRRGDVLGFVGTTGNAPETAPHLHFAVFERTDPQRWWTGRPINPYAVWR